MAATSIEATYRVTTPMFCGGANGRDAELRVPSFKGVLRFWWRALAWSRLNGDLKAIHNEEARLFGSADAGQSKVTMRLMGNPDVRTSYGHEMRVSPGARYLAYGVMEHADNRKRSYLEAPFDFTIGMRGRKLSEAQTNSLMEALTAQGVMGGMGAKSRNGFGSMALQSITVGGVRKWGAPQSANNLVGHIKSLMPASLADGFPKYTAVSSDSRILIIERMGQGRSQDALGMLGEIGNRLKDTIGAVNGVQRAAFGLPRRGVLPSVERRASPLFIHIHQVDNTPVGILTFLPARFLNEGGSRLPQEDELYRPIHDFLDGLKSSWDGIRAREVTP